MQQQLFVDPAIGNDDYPGSREQPFKTLTTALKSAARGSEICLAPGEYTRQQGELFPIVIPGGVSLVGDVANQGQGVVIRGSGIYRSDRLKAQNVAIALMPDSAIRGITVINLEQKSTGVWIEAGRVTIENNCFQHCRREAIFAAGTSKPLIFDNLFLENKGNGIFLANFAKGEICHNQFRGNQYAIALNEDASPLIAHNRIAENEIGIFIAKRTTPVLRRNLIEQNQQLGLVISGTAQPDLGFSQAPGGNILRQNRQADLQNKTETPALSVGNELQSTTVMGLVEFGDAVVPQSHFGVTPFRDVLNHWAEPFLQVLVDRGYLKGFPDGTFRPDEILTRAGFATFLAHCFDLPRPLGTQGSAFADVEPDFWGAEAIAKVVSMGFLQGYPDQTFRPHQPVTRLQALLSLAKGLGLKDGNPRVLQIYSDRPQIPSYALNAIAAATQHYLVVNYPKQDLLQPLRKITRGEVVALLHQALVVNQKLPIMTCGYIVDPLPYLPSLGDVTYHWAKPFITAIANLGLVQGHKEGIFRPDHPLNRAEFAALLNEIFAPLPVRPAGTFFDIPEDFWAATAIQQVYRGGFLSGFPDQTFHPNQQVKRVQVILALANGLTLTNGPAHLLDYYFDAMDIPDYGEKAVAAATQARIVVSYPEPRCLNPRENVTRAEAIAMCYQALVFLGRAYPINADSIVNPVS